MLDRKNFYIDGKWVSPEEPKNFKVIDPTNEEILHSLNEIIKENQITNK